MLHFSVPLAADIAHCQGDTDVTVTGDSGAEVTGMAENEDNDGNGTIMIDPSGGAGLNLLIQGVKLDVSGADGAVTVTLKVTAGEDDFIRIDGPSSAMVIGGIKVGVEASVDDGYRSNPRHRCWRSDGLSNPEGILQGCLHDGQHGDSRFLRHPGGSHAGSHSDE